MVNIRIVEFNDHQAQIREIRGQVFTREQGVDPALDFDGLDDQAIQALAFQDGKPVGTGRMLSDGHIGRIAVLREQRNRGIGQAIMQALIVKARRERFPHLFLHAQVTAIPFYKRLGFVSCGNEFLEADIRHIPMELGLSSGRE